MKRVFTILALIGVATSIHASPKRYYIRQDKNGVNPAFEEIFNLIDDMKVVTNNHESELNMFQEKLTNQEVALDDLWKQINELTQGSKDRMRSVVEQLEMKFANLESSLNTYNDEFVSIKNDLHQITQQKNKIHALEKMVEVQNQNVEHLQAALQALMDALQIKDVSVLSDDPYRALPLGAIYQVKPGDSLEKIARKNNTTVSKLKEINHLNDKDLIIVGQKLRIPE